MNIFVKAILVVMLLGMLACGKEEPPVPQPSETRKKISAQKAAPQAKKPVVNATTQVAAEKLSTSPQSDAPTPSGDDDNSTSKLIQESLEIASTYDPKGRFDPFEPLFKEEASIQEVKPTKGKKSKRIPQTPLERVAISQLKLTAIIRSPNGNIALVEDATNKGYPIRKGTYVGLNSGQVVQIERDRVVIEEEVENLLGEWISQTTELKLQKPAGEL